VSELDGEIFMAGSDIDRLTGGKKYKKPLKGVVVIREGSVQQIWGTASAMPWDDSARYYLLEKTEWEKALHKKNQTEDGPKKEKHQKVGDCLMDCLKSNEEIPEFNPEEVSPPEHDHKEESNEEPNEEESDEPEEEESEESEDESDEKIS